MPDARGERVLEMVDIEVRVLGEVAPVVSVRRVTRSEVHVWNELLGRGAVDTEASGWSYEELLGLGEGRHAVVPRRGVTA